MPVRRIIIFGLGLFLLAVYSLLVGCASGGGAIDSGKSLNKDEIYPAFRDGALRLTCGLACSGTWGSNASRVEKLYSSGKWRGLVFKVAEIGFRQDLTYFYLGRAAEAKGYPRAAQKYYRISLATPQKCKYASDACWGISVGEEAKKALARLESMGASPSLEINSATLQEAAEPFYIAEEGVPVSVGGLRLGMTLDDAFSILSVRPKNCGNARIWRHPFFRMNILSEVLDCFDAVYDGDGGFGRAEMGAKTFEVYSYSGYSTDGRNTLINKIGEDLSLMFHEDKLVYIEVGSPKVGVEYLAEKYNGGSLRDDTYQEACQNKIGNAFENRVGTTGVHWKGVAYSAEFELEFYPPRETCTDTMNNSNYRIYANEYMSFLRNYLDEMTRKKLREESQNHHF